MKYVHPIIHGDKIIKHTIDTLVLAGIPLSIFQSIPWSSIYSVIGIIWLLLRMLELDSKKIMANIYKIKKWFGFETPS